MARTNTCALALLACTLLAGAARAEEGETWVFRKGEVRTEVEVGGMPPDVRLALRQQLEAQGWKRVDPTDLAAPADAPRAAPPAPQAAAPGAASEPPATARTRETLLDIEELVRRGGRLPEGFRPHGLGGPGAGLDGEGPAEDGLFGEDRLLGLARVTGRLILKALDARADPVQGPIYEGLLREMGELLSGLDPLETTLGEVPLQVMQRFLRGLGDPQRAPVYREQLAEILQALRAPLDPAAGLGAGPALPGLTILGARAAPQAADGVDEAAGMAWIFRAVPRESLAAQIGIQAGDALLALDGLAVSPASLDALAEAVRQRGQRSLTLRRKDGRTQVVDVAFE